MKREQKREIVATLLKAGRRDLAKRFVGAVSVDLGNELKAMRESWNRNNSGATFHFKWKNNPFEILLFEREDIVTKNGVTQPERTLHLSSHATGVKKKAPPKEIVEQARQYVLKRVGWQNIKASTGRKRVFAAKKHKDVEFQVAGHKSTFKTWDEACGAAVAFAVSKGRSTIDVLVWSEAGAKALEGDYGVEQYREDPDASVYERIEITANSQGRIA